MPGRIRSSGPSVKAGAALQLPACVVQKPAMLFPAFATHCATPRSPRHARHMSPPSNSTFLQARRDHASWRKAGIRDVGSYYLLSGLADSGQMLQL